MSEIIKDIYKRILENPTIPEGCSRVVFEFDKTQSARFWENQNGVEKNELLTKWESNQKGTYTTKFYGVEIGVRFNADSSK